MSDTNITFGEFEQFEKDFPEMLTEQDRKDLAILRRQGLE